MPKPTASAGSPGKTPLRTAEALIAAHPLLATLPPDALEEARRQARRLFLSPGETLYAAGAPARTLFVILSGAFQIEYPKGRDARGFVAAMILSPALIGESQALSAGAWSGNGVALTPLSVLALEGPHFERLLRAHAAFATCAYLELAGRFLGAIEAWKHQQKAPPEQTVARYLLSYFDVLDQVGVTPREALAVNQQALAVATGLRRETVHRLLKRWTRDGRVTLAKRGVTHVDATRLAAALPEKQNRLLVQRAQWRR